MLSYFFRKCTRTTGLVLLSILSEIFRITHGLAAPDSAVDQEKNEELHDGKKIPPVTLRSNLSLYIPFLHYYDLIFFESPLVPTSDVLDRNAHDELAIATANLVQLLPHFSREHVPAQVGEAVQDVLRFVARKFSSEADTSPTTPGAPIFLALARIAQLQFLANAHTVFPSAECVWGADRISRVVCGSDGWQCNANKSGRLAARDAIALLRDQVIRDHHLTTVLQPPGEAAGALESESAQSENDKMKRLFHLPVSSCVSLTTYATLSLGLPVPWHYFLQNSGSTSTTLPLLPPLLHTLDHLARPATVQIDLRAPGFIDSENHEFRLEKDQDLKLTLAVFPERELVSDFLRARKVPYCNGGVLKAVETWFFTTSEVKQRDRTAAAAAHEDRSAEPLHLIEVGANLGDCLLFLLKKHAHWTGQAVEAVPRTAQRLRESVRLNQLGHRLEVVNRAVSAENQKFIPLKSKPFSLNSASFTGTDDEANEGSGSHSSSVGSTTSGANVEQNHAVVRPRPKKRLKSARTTGVVSSSRALLRTAATTTTTGDEAQNKSGRDLRVPTCRLDDAFFFPKAADVLLLNTNGHELSVLRSLEARSMPDLIVLQMYARDHGVAKDPNYSAAEIFRFLFYRGYSMHWTNDPIGENKRIDSLRDFYLLLATVSPVFDLVAQRRKGSVSRRTTKVAHGQDEGDHDGDSNEKFHNALLVRSLEAEWRLRHMSQADNETPFLAVGNGETPSSWVEVSAGRLRDNWRRLSSLVPAILHRALPDAAAPEIGVVLKSNAYGHGVGHAAKILAEDGAKTFFVDSLQDAIKVHESLVVPDSTVSVSSERDVRPEIEDQDFEIVLLYRAPRSLAILCELAARKISVTVLSLRWLEEMLASVELQFSGNENAKTPVDFSVAEVCRGVIPAPTTTVQKLRVHLWFDSGLAREGLDYDSETIARLSKMLMKNAVNNHNILDVRGVGTSWCCVNDLEAMEHYAAKFRETAEVLRATVLKDKEVYFHDPAASADEPQRYQRALFKLHTIASSGLHHPHLYFDLVRIGGFLFGQGGTLGKDQVRLQSALLWKSVVSSLHWFDPRQERMGYCDLQGEGCLQPAAAVLLPVQKLLRDEEELVHILLRDEEELVHGREDPAVGDEKNKMWKIAVLPVGSVDFAGKGFVVVDRPLLSDADEQDAKEEPLPVLFQALSTTVVGISEVVHPRTFRQIRTGAKVILCDAECMRTRPVSASVPRIRVD
ncbi:unnamed protein product [Amoebophrya sp. A120]|nr:unnamed protein product [Amoebophrya sp. A120]|eukprot:GSA120T00001508001.1